MLLSTTPTTEQALIQRVQGIAGLTLAQLAARHEMSVPESLLRSKGWIGQLLEVALGTDAGNRALPDFTQLGIELKTIPVDLSGMPQESTYITTVSLLGAPGLCWETSELYIKMKKMLWIPIESDKTKPLGQRRIGLGFIWTLQGQDEANVRADWEELMSYVRLGKLDEISGRMGRSLHIRPKAANSKALTWGIGPEGERIQTLPRGFYLRAQFTQQILQQA